MRRREVLLAFAASPAVALGGAARDPQLLLRYENIIGLYHMWEVVDQFGQVAETGKVYPSEEKALAAGRDAMPAIEKPLGVAVESIQLLAPMTDSPGWRWLVRFQGGPLGAFRVSSRERFKSESEAAESLFVESSRGILGKAFGRLK